MKRSKRAIIIVGSAISVIVLVGMVLAIHDSGSSDDGQIKRVTFHEVRPDDLPALEEWARLRCKGNSVKKLASALKIEPRLEVVVAYIGRGLPARSQAAVEKVCRAELKDDTDEKTQF